MAMTKAYGVQLGPVEVEASGLATAACLFHGFSDPSRIAILRHLASGEHRVVDLTAHLGLAQSTTSAHLACLRDCGLVSVRTVGRSSVYSLAVESELMGVLGSAERLLAATGVRPQVDEVVPLAEAARGFERLVAGDVVGKVVLTA